MNPLVRERSAIMTANITSTATADSRKPLPPNLSIKFGDTVYKVTSIYANKGDFRKLWESLIVGRLTAISACKSN
jgi:hypothetical protein